ncbi:glycosyltransferase family 2 protein [Haloferax denitrificans]|uniref:glycosyltransferase family 2 protein n=1 Tax=Haloferax denitrificans TaxID=35745 RepID=UPI003C6F145A
MLASVVIPTYNRPERLKSSIESVANQSTDDYEVLVVDDGSDNPQQDEVLTQIEAKYSKVRIIRQQNSGPAAARNRGWHEAKTNTVLFTDDDCIVPPNWVASLSGAFEPKIAAVGGPFIPADCHFRNSYFAKYHRKQAEDQYRPIEQSRTQEEPLPHGITANIAYKKEVLEEVSGFDESFPIAGGEDADLIKRVGDLGYSFKYIPTPVHHNDKYTIETFLKRSYNRGKGLYYLHERHGPRRGLFRVLLGLCATPLFLPHSVIHEDGLQMAAIAFTDRLVNRLGELSAMYDNFK